MQIGAVLPHDEIGTDPGAIKADLQGVEQIAAHRTAAGRTMDGFGVQAQAQWGGGNPERWQPHFDTWQDIGATHLAVATHHAGRTDVDGHLARIAEYRDAVAG